MRVIATILLLLFSGLVFAEMPSPIVVISHDVGASKVFWAQEGREGLRSKVDGIGGKHKKQNGNWSVYVLSGSEGLDELLNSPHITVTSYEEIFGYWRQVEDENGLVFGPDIIVVEPEHFVPFVIGHEDDLTKPIPVMEAVFEDWERVFIDENGNEIRISEQRLTGYRQIGTDGYYQKEVYGSRLIQEQTFTTTNPIMELIPPIMEMRNRYRNAYPKTEIQTEYGLYTSPPLMGIPAGWNMSHLDIK